MALDAAGDGEEGVLVSELESMYTDVNHLFGKPPSAHVLAQYLDALSTGAVPAPDIKSYRDVVYLNYPTLGVSFQFSPRNGYRPAPGLRLDQLRDDDLALEAIDIYNVPGAGRTTDPAFCAYPGLPVELHLAGRAVVRVAKDTTGKEFVGWLGEPSRKGGGAGPSSGSIHIWCEWSQQGIMVEFLGSDARGPQAWERGGNAVWRVVTVFRVSQ